MTTALFVLFAILGLTVVGLISYYQLRQSGPGPRVGYVPPRLRPALNRLYERRGWTGHFRYRGDL